MCAQRARRRWTQRGDRPWYGEASAAYEIIVQDFPDARGVALSRIGVGRFFFGQYAEAITDYEQALAAGEDARMMNDNIQEAGVPWRSCS